MKTKIQVTLAVLSLTSVMMMSSCKKIYSCECETKLSAPGFSQTNKTSESYSAKLKEKQAKAACDNTADIMEKTIKDLNSGSGISASVSCELK